MVCLRATSFNTVLLNPSVVCKQREIYFSSHSSVLAGFQLCWMEATLSLVYSILTKRMWP